MRTKLLTISGSVTMLILVGCLAGGDTWAQRTQRVEVLVIGGGASGTAAGIQAARMGAEVLVLAETDWLGGMLTAAGVSATDGNHQLPSGLWGEFRQHLYAHYGGPTAVATGWVSHTQFEPSVGARIWRTLADSARLSVWYQAQWQTVERRGDVWHVTVRHKKRTRHLRARVLIDATELGDVLAAAGAPFDVGMDSRVVTGESMAPEQANDIVQDLTYAAILQDYGPEADCTIARPGGYDPASFRCACRADDPTGKDCRQMLDYGKLPNGKYMLNWPRCGNDYYANLILMSATERADALRAAKLETLRFIYYIQTELGFRHLGLAWDEFPTSDGLPLIPYHREARRVRGVVRLTLPYLANPYGQPQSLYRTGIAVGDYPIDHHHLKNPDAPAIEFIEARIPAYNIPLGSLLPQETPGLIVAEKSISVSNVVNGTTRLQPVVLGIGQAAGTLAALSVRQQRLPQQVPVRDVQTALLASGGYLMPFLDVPPKDPYFGAIQRVGATGLLRGTGVPYQWANQMWFYPHHLLSEHTLAQGLRSFYPEYPEIPASGADLTLTSLARLLAPLKPEMDTTATRAAAAQYLPNFVAPESPLTRSQVAVLLDALLDPFAQPIDLTGQRLGTRSE